MLLTKDRLEFVLPEEFSGLVPNPDFDPEQHICTVDDDGGFPLPDLHQMFLGFDAFVERWRERWRREAVPVVKFHPVGISRRIG